jgi:hypothetical protein
MNHAYFKKLFATIAASLLPTGYLWGQNMAGYVDNSPNLFTYIFASINNKA